MTAAFLAALLLLPAAVSGQEKPVDPLAEAQRRAGEAILEAKDPAQGRREQDADLSDYYGPESDEPLPNFGKVDGRVYRSAQPSAEGISQAAELGVGTVLVLRMDVGDEEKDAAKKHGLAVVNVKMNGILAPKFGEVDEALAALAASKKPSLVHCRFGKDRTGLVVGAYRVMVNGWEPERAAEEAKKFGCCHTLFPDPADYLRKYRDHRLGFDVVEPVGPAVETVPPTPDRP